MKREVEAESGNRGGYQKPAKHVPRLSRLCQAFSLCEAVLRVCDCDCEVCEKCETVRLSVGVRLRLPDVQTSRLEKASCQTDRVARQRDRDSMICGSHDTFSESRCL